MVIDACARAKARDVFPSHKQRFLEIFDRAHCQIIAGNGAVTRQEMPNVGGRVERPKDYRIRLSPWRMVVCGLDVLETSMMALSNCGRFHRPYFTSTGPRVGRAVHRAAPGRRSVADAPLWRAPRLSPRASWSCRRPFQPLKTSEKPGENSFSAIFDVQSTHEFWRGGYNAGIGIESSNNRILDMMQKKTTIEAVQKGIRIFREAGIEVLGQFVIGSPGDTLETVKESIEFAKTFGT